MRFWQGLAVGALGLIQGARCEETVRSGRPNAAAGTPAPTGVEPGDASELAAAQQGVGNFEPRPLTVGSAQQGGAGAASAMPRSDPKTFACGRQTCRAGNQTCCAGASEASACQPTVQDGPHGTVGALRAQFESCSAAQPGSLAGISRCDESIDCPGSELCCEQALFSGGRAMLCEPQPANGVTPCELGEVCGAGLSCRMPGTVCVGDTCVKPLAGLPCGAALCSESQSCCGDPLTCKPHADCDPREPLIACTKPQDCVNGHACVLESGRRAYCTGLLDRVTPGWWQERGLATVCQRDSDCIGKCAAKGQRTRCKAAAFANLAACFCS